MWWDAASAPSDQEHVELDGEWRTFQGARGFHARTTTVVPSPSAGAAEDAPSIEQRLIRYSADCIEAENVEALQFPRDSEEQSFLLVEAGLDTLLTVEEPAPLPLVSTDVVDRFCRRHAGTGVDDQRTYFGYPVVTGPGKRDLPTVAPLLYTACSLERSPDRTWHAHADSPSSS